MKYKGSSDLWKHLQYWKASWIREGLLEDLWVKKFIHTLGTFPKAWYVKEEIRRRTSD